LAEPPQARRFCGHCLARPLPDNSPLLRPGSFGLGVVAPLSRRPAQNCRAGFAVATDYPLGNCVGVPVETSVTPDSAWSRFLIAPGRAAPDSHHRTVATPPRGAGDSCLAPRRLRTVRRGESNQLRLSVPRLPGIIPRGCPPAVSLLSKLIPDMSSSRPQRRY
jgi:hypothetical protein